MDSSRRTQQHWRFAQSAQFVQNAVRKWSNHFILSLKKSAKNSLSVPERLASEEQDWHQVSETVTFDLKPLTSDQVNLDSTRKFEPNFHSSVVFTGAGQTKRPRNQRL